MPILGSEKNPKEVETIIGPSVKVEGNFTGEGNVIVEGVLNGTLKTNHSLKVGNNAKIKADIEAHNAFIAGEVKGNVKIKEKTILTSSGKIMGNLETKLLVVEEGALINGKCVMIQEAPSSEIKRNTK